MHQRLKERKEGRMKERKERERTTKERKSEIKSKKKYQSVIYEITDPPPSICALAYEAQRQRLAAVSLCGLEAHGGGQVGMCIGKTSMWLLLKVESEPAELKFLTHRSSLRNGAKRDKAKRDCETWKENGIEARTMQAHRRWLGMSPEAECGDRGVVSGCHHTQEMEQGRQ